ncbi:MAG: carbohydrate-binding domain-containing protein, partial [Ruminococcus sp.]
MCWQTAQSSPAQTAIPLYRRHADEPQRFGQRHICLTGTLTKFTDVKELTGGSELPDDDSVVTALVYSGSVTATNASGVVSNPSNLTISGANVTITASSEISVSGESTSGQLAVNVDKTAEPEGKVVLNLEGLTLSNSSAAPIYVEAIGDEVQISAKNGTTNTI